MRVRHPFHRFFADRPRVRCRLHRLCPLRVGHCPPGAGRGAAAPGVPQRERPHRHAAGRARGAAERRLLDQGLRAAHRPLRARLLLDDGRVCQLRASGHGHRRVGVGTGLCVHRAHPHRPDGLWGVAGDEGMGRMPLNSPGELGMLLSEARKHSCQGCIPVHPCLCIRSPI